MQKRGSGVFGWVEWFEERLVVPLGSVLFFVSGAVMMTEALGRRFLAVSYDWPSEVVTFAMLWAVTLTFARGAAGGHHVRTTLVLDRLPSRLRSGVERFVAFLSMLFCILAGYSSALQGYHLYSRGVSSSSSLYVPMYVSYVPLFLGWLLLGLYFLKGVLVAGPCKGGNDQA